MIYVKVKYVRNVNLYNFRTKSVFLKNKYFGKLNQHLKQANVHVVSVHSKNLMAVCIWSVLLVSISGAGCVELQSIAFSIAGKEEDLFVR